MRKAKNIIVIVVIAILIIGVSVISTKLHRVNSNEHIENSSSTEIKDNNTYNTYSALKNNTNTSKKQLNTVETVYENDKIETTTFKRNNNKIETTFKKYELGLVDYSTDKVCDRTQVIIPENFKSLDDTSLDIVYINTNDDVSIMIETYNFSGTTKTWSELKDKVSTMLNDVVTFNNGVCTNIENVNDNLMIFESIIDNYYTLNIYKYNNKECVSYSISLEMGNKSAIKTVNKYIEALEINYNIQLIKQV